MARPSLNGEGLSHLSLHPSNLCRRLRWVEETTGTDALPAFRTHRCHPSRSGLMINEILRSDQGRRLAPLALGKSPPGSSKSRLD